MLTDQAALPPPDQNFPPRLAWVPRPSATWHLELGLVSGIYGCVRGRACFIRP